MTKVTILPVPGDNGDIFYHAVSGDRQAAGNTAGEALDSLTPQLHEDDTGTLIIIQNLKPDRFFNNAQRIRLSELMARWRSARDQGHALSPDEQRELGVLVDAELHASSARAAEMVGKVNS